MNVRMLTIYHNPRCSKSREALALTEQFAQARGLALTIVDYQKTPLTAAQLDELQRMLACPLREMVRSNEEAYAILDLAHADDAALLAALAGHPRLLQRPIVTWKDRALVARPPQQLPAWLEATA